MASFQPALKAESVLPLQQMRRYLVLHLPRWATDCLRRADPALQTLTRPLALWERQKGAMRLVAVDAGAAQQGLFVEQSLSDARALCPNLEVREIDRGCIEYIFAGFADWHSNASPIVSVLTDAAPYGDLVLDITGVSHLFGGEHKMLTMLTTRLTALGYSVAGAIAPSVGAAWALAHFNPGTIAGAEIAGVLGDLPVAALRLNEAQISALAAVGLKRIGQLYGRDRKAMQARFGAMLILRLDQALGQVEERVTPRLPLAEHYVERRFAEPIGLIGDVMMCAADLAAQLGARLETHGLGAQSFHLFVYRVDHQVMTLSINAARATRDPAHISRLFAHRVEQLSGDYDPGFGIDMIRLAASSLSEIDPTQIGAFEIDDGAADLDRLYDRITSRLGPLALVRSKFVNTHIPEQAVKHEPVIARTPDDPLAGPDARVLRPLRLLPAPEPVDVSLAEVPDGPPPGMIWRRVSYRFIKTSGPERIGVEWWRPDDRALTRDYYAVEDENGRRFWLFREGLYGEASAPKWFLHGFFA